MTDVRIGVLKTGPFGGKLATECFWRRLPTRREFLRCKDVHHQPPSPLRPSLSVDCRACKATSKNMDLETNWKASSLVDFDEALRKLDLDVCWSLLCKLKESENEREPFFRDVMGKRLKLFIERCVRAGRYDLVFHHVHAFTQTDRSFSFLLSTCLKCGNYENVLELIELQSQIGLKPNPYSYNAHISALGKLGKLSEAEKVFNNAKASLNDSIYVHNTMLDAYARIGAVTDALAVWNGITEAGLVPDSVSYVGIMRAYGAQGNITRVLHLYNEMCEKKIELAPHAFTIVLDCITKTNYMVGGAWLQSFIKSMHEAQVQMNHYILGAMINAFSRQELDTEHFQFVFQTIYEFRQKAMLGKAVYGSWIEFCFRSGIPEMSLKIWRLYKEDGNIPNGYIYTLLLKCCCKMKEANNAHALVDELTGFMKSDWLCMKERKDREDYLRPAFNALLNFYGQMKNHDKVTEFYTLMLKVGPHPNLITYNTVMAAFSNCGMFELTEDVRRRMKDAGEELDATSYGILLNTCAQMHDLEKAWSVWNKFKHSQLPLTVESYTSLINTCIKGGSVRSIQSAFELFSEMKELNLKPTAVTYGCMFSAFKLQEDVDGAFELYQEACRVGVSPSDQCHNILINMCTKAGRLEDGLELIKVLVRKHGNIEEEGMNSIIRALSTFYLGRSLVLLRLMEHRNLKPTAKTFNCLILACCRESEIQKAFTLYKQMISMRVPIRQEEGSALIKTLSIAGEVQAALMVTNHMFEKAGLRSIDISSIRKGLVDNEVPSTGRKEIILYSSLPSAISLGYLAATLARMDSLNISIYIFRQIVEIESVSGVIILAQQIPQVFEALIELSCRLQKLNWAMEIYHQWKVASKAFHAENKNTTNYLELSLATLAFLQANCSHCEKYSIYVDDICQTIQEQRILYEGHSNVPYEM